MGTYICSAYIATAYIATAFTVGPNFCLVSSRFHDGSIYLKFGKYYASVHSLNSCTCKLLVTILSFTDNWVSLEYEGGDPYHTFCKKEGKRTIIMITCLSGKSGVSQLKFLTLW